MIVLYLGYLRKNVAPFNWQLLNRTIRCATVNIVGIDYLRRNYLDRN